jgi:hypothetical protein
VGHDGNDEGAREWQGDEAQERAPGAEPGRDLHPHTPEGTSVTEYQLLRLEVHGDRREFRAMTGDVIHTSGGAEKNAVAFQPEKVGKRIWKVALNDMKKGEYGFLPPGVSAESLSSAGRVYSFGVIE